MLHQLVPWFGGKAALSKWIVTEFGPHSSYFEPFTGGCAILFRKLIAPHETINDLHEDVTNLARVIADTADHQKLVRSLAYRINCEALQREARDRLRKPFVAGVDRAADFLYASWLAMNGYIGTQQHLGYAAQYKRASSSKSHKLQAAIESIRWWHDRMKHVAVLNRDGFELLAKVPDDSKTVVYCDPPYVVKSGRYRIDFAVGDHERLAQALARFRKTRVVVSYYDHPLLDQLYAGWHKRILNEWKTRSHNGVRKPKPSEILLINGPSLVPPTSPVASRAAGQSLAV